MSSGGRWWGRSRRPLLGVDVGGSGIRVVELAGSGQALRIAHCAHYALPYGMLHDGAISVTDAAVDALRSAVRDSGSRVRDAVLALPSGAVISKTLSLPADLDEDELEMQVEAEAEATLPFARTEISLDFTTIGPSAAQADCIDVMLVAARRERIDERVELARLAGLKPVAIDIESHALMSAVAVIDAARGIASPRLLAVLRLDAEASHCFFMIGGTLLYERELGTTARRDSGAAEVLCQEFRRAQQLFQASTAHSELHQVYLLGSVPDGLPAALGQQLGVPVTSPDSQLHWFCTAPADGDPASAWMLACGLALRRVDA